MDPKMSTGIAIDGVDEAAEMTRICPPARYGEKVSD
jgi:hypothetical protein